MTLNKYIFLSITCPVSPVTHVKFLYPQHLLERSSIVLFAFDCCDPVHYQLHFVVLLS